MAELINLFNLLILGIIISLAVFVFRDLCSKGSSVLNALTWGVIIMFFPHGIFIYYYLHYFAKKI